MTATPSTATAWVTRSGSQLQLAGKPWRFAGVNMYWLGLDENVTDAAGPTYPTHAAVDNGFSAARSLGAGLVRSISLGVSVGSPRSLEPTLGHFNDAAFASIDYAVADARRYGVRLMIPLTDEWHYYHGGKHTFTNWLGYPDAPGQNCVTDAGQRQREAEFYTDPRIVAAFHAYVAHLLNHVNPYTGLRLGSDPTIAIWETGNEVWDAPTAWTEQTAAYIKSLAPHALVADGSAATGKAISETAYAAPHVDLIDAHFYPTSVATMTSDARFTAAHGKAYMVGEFPLTTQTDSSWTTALATDRDVAGGLAWSLFPWLSATQPEQHDDGYTFHYPGANATERSAVTRLQAYAKQVAGTN
ncbi:hypothetical protein [uncultured Jatrophihabitans sp.]|uniref:hypothetical protein n=1 Tax=uncultured Jatrophihabitans sp. TaxID=1610747 RepID=UPI0035CCA4A0